MAFVHSLHGNNAVYILQPARSIPILFNIAFSSAWHMYGYLVSRNSPSLYQGKSSSLQPIGSPLYPAPTILFFSFTIQAPTCVLGSLLLLADSNATPMKYSSHEI